MAAGRRPVVAREQLLRAVAGTTVDVAVGSERVRLAFSSGLLAAVTRTMVGPQVSLDYAAADRAVVIGSPSQPQLTALLTPT